MSNVKTARIRKTRLFFENKNEFIALLSADIVALVAGAKKEGKKACVRLNGTSDIPFERLGIFDKFPEVQFYDYTKSLSRALSFCAGTMPKNYNLTFSRSETNEIDAIKVLKAGGNVAVVFENELPANWSGYDVVNGDESDLRFGDKQNVVVGLSAKGQAKKDESGFVV